VESVKGDNIFDILSYLCAMFFNDCGVLSGIWLALEMDRFFDFLDNGHGLDRLVFCLSGGDAVRVWNIDPDFKWAKHDRPVCYLLWNDRFNISIDKKLLRFRIFLLK